MKTALFAIASLLIAATTASAQTRLDSFDFESFQESLVITVKYGFSDSQKCVIWRTTSTSYYDGEEAPQEIFTLYTLVTDDDYIVVESDETFPEDAAEMLAFYKGCGTDDAIFALVDGDEYKKMVWYTAVGSSWEDYDGENLGPLCEWSQHNAVYDTGSPAKLWDFHFMDFPEEKDLLIEDVSAENPKHFQGVDKENFETFVRVCSGKAGFEMP